MTLDRVMIDEKVKGLLEKGVEKAGSKHALARVMGYSTPSNIIAQFLFDYDTSPKTLPKWRLDRLRKFLEEPA
ncbi:MAG: hypothetical protein ACLP9D_13025 [Candidatus Bathyarchaeia archaeon]